MSLIDFKSPNDTQQGPDDSRIIREIEKLRKEASRFFEGEDFDNAYARIVECLHALHGFSDYSDMEFRAILVVLLFDLAEIHYAKKDYKQAKKQLERIFKYLEPLLKHDADRFGQLHVLAMELSTRILRSRKRTLDMLAKQQLHTGMLYDKVNAGVAAATDKLVDSLCKNAALMASAGDYKGAVRFYMEAIKLSKKRTGRVTPREIEITIEMARQMMHSRQQTARARRLLEAALPHATGNSPKLVEEIESLIRTIDEKPEVESMWRNFLGKVQSASKYLKWERNKKKNEEEESKESEE